MKRFLSITLQCVNYKIEGYYYRNIQSPFIDNFEDCLGLGHCMSNAFLFSTFQNSETDLWFTLFRVQFYLIHHWLASRIFWGTGFTSNLSNGLEILLLSLWLIWDYQNLCLQYHLAGTKLTVYWTFRKSDYFY